MGPDIVGVPESRCLNCRHPMNTLGTGERGAPARPRPGDVVVCIRCGAVMKLDKELRLRGMSQREIDRLLADRGWMNQIARMVRRVYLLRHMKG